MSAHALRQPQRRDIAFNPNPTKDNQEQPMSARYEVHGDIAVITLNNPPVNGLGLSTRQGIATGFGRAMADSAVKGHRHHGRRQGFLGRRRHQGVRLPQSAAEPNLLTSSLADDATKPVVAAMQWRVHGRRAGTGAGLPLPHRCAGLRMALPEVKIGLIPGAGGTQRLPRVLGVETALNMIVSGEPVKSEMLASRAGPEAVRQSMVGRQALLGRSHGLGESRWPGSWPKRRACRSCATCKVRTRNGDAYFQFARNMVKAMAKNFPAPAQVRGCVEAAMKMKFDDGMRYERELFIDLMMTPECRRCAMPSSPNAPPPRSPTCLRTRPSARSNRWP